MTDKLTFVILAALVFFVAFEAMVHFAESLPLPV
jgi:hypothetical protein